MIGVALKGLLGRKLRATLTAFAIVLGVAMISGAFILTDTLGKSFDGIYSDSYKATDAVISSKVAVKTADGDSEAPAFSNSVLTKVESLPGVQSRAGRDRGRVEARRQEGQGHRQGGRRCRDRHRSVRRSEPQPAPARQRAVAQRRRPDRDRQSDR